MKSWASQQKAFTLVELLIVIAVVGILAAVTIIGYNGVQDRARKTAVMSELTTASDKIDLYFADNIDYPASLSAAGVTASNGVTFQYTRSGTGIDSSYCITGMKDGQQPHNTGENRTPTEGPCDGHSGGASYCPEDGYVAINGYFCNGSINGVATLHNAAVKLDASASGVPAGAPGGYVGRQTSRDNIGSNIFTVSTGQVYCTSGWAATPSSTVTHSVGLMLTGTSGTTWLRGGPALSPTSTWSKIAGCITIPSGYTNARLWTQNDGAPGGTADVAWYQTAIKLTKQ